MNDIVRREADELATKMEWSRTMATASLLPRQYRDNPGNLLFAVEYADALGVNRMAAITSIHVIEGKPSASSDLIANLVRKAGHKLRISGDDTHARAQLIRADDPDFTYETLWTIEKARTAGLLGKDVWKKYPGAMLRARAITDVARMGASDALFGMIYTPEELGATTDETGQVVHTVTSVQPAATRPAGVDRMRDALAGAPAMPTAPPEPAPTAAVTPAEAPEVDGITSAQLKKLGAGMRDAGITDRADALAFVADVIGRQVTSRNDLTKDEASRVIDRLERLQTAAGVVDAEIVEENTFSGDDSDEVWAQCLELGKQLGMTAADVEDDASGRLGLSAGEASAAELNLYLGDLQRRAA